VELRADLRLDRKLNRRAPIVGFPVGIWSALAVERIRALDEGFGRTDRWTAVVDDAVPVVVNGVAARRPALGGVIRLPERHRQRPDGRLERRVLTGFRVHVEVQRRLCRVGREEELRCPGDARITAAEAR
jgi:hypothetical protein